MLSWGKDSLTCSCYHSQQFLPWIVPCSLVICGTSLFLKKTSLYLIYNLLLVLGVQRDSVYVRNAKYKTKTSLLNIHHHTYYKFIISTVLTFEISSEWQSSLGGSQVNSYCEPAVWTLRQMCTMPALPLCTCHILLCWALTEMRWSLCFSELYIEIHFPCRLFLFSTYRSNWYIVSMVSKGSNKWKGNDEGDCGR